MTELDSGVDTKNLAFDYLGRGVDGRTPPERWLDALDAYSSEKIRNVHPKGENIFVKPVSQYKFQLSCQTKKSTMNVEGNFNVKPHSVLQLGGKLTAKRDTNKMWKSHKIHHITRRVIMYDDTSKDPGTITRNGTHYTKYECELSQFILEHIGALQREAKVESSTDEDVNLGKDIADLKGEDAVAKLDDYLNDVRQRKKSELTQHLWQIVADACCAFMDERKYTDYVYDIVLGASSQESFDADHSSNAISGGVQGKGAESVDVGATGGFQKERKRNSIKNDTRGVVDSSGAVTNEEVIDVALKPVSALINRNSRELKVLLEGLLRCYKQQEKGDPLGPFLICCVPGLQPKLYWQVSNDEVHCTTETTKASRFHVHIKYGSKQFHITHLESMKTVTVQRKSIFDRTTKPLKLVPIPTPRDMHLKLQLTTKKSVVVPQNTIAWEEKSPFFVKFSKSWGHFSRYIAVIECDENTTTKDDTGSHDEKSKTERATVTKNGNSESPPKYKLVSCAKHDGSDYKLMPLHFEPAVTSKLPEPVTLTGTAKGPPPPPQSRIVCDFSLPVDGDETNNSTLPSLNESPLESNPIIPTDDAESNSSSSPSNISRNSSLTSPIDQPFAESDSDTAQEENPNEINNAFFELVGDEYDFPLNINM